jgi:hypothetical protein
MWSAVPSAAAGTRSGAFGVNQSVASSFVVGAIIAYAASEIMRPKCPNVSPPKWVSMARELDWRNFLVAWMV